MPQNKIQSADGESCPRFFVLFEFNAEFVQV